MKTSLINIGTHFLQKQAISKIVRKYNLTGMWMEKTFDTLFTVFILSKKDGWVGSADVKTFMEVDPAKESTPRAVRMRLKALLDKGFIEEKKTRGNTSGYRPSIIGTAIIRGYFETIEEGIELMIDTDTLPPESIKDYRKWKKL